MRAVVAGVGAVGGRAARQLVSTLDGLDELVVVDKDRLRAAAVAESLGPPAVARGWSATTGEKAQVVVLARPGGHSALARSALEQGAHVVSVSDREEDVRALLALDGEARDRGLHVVVGAGFSPGMACVLARHAAGLLDAVEEVHVARAGTGGPACALQHHQALGQPSLDWRDGEWARASGGTGRELRWFPEPVGGLDCYRSGLPDALVLVPAFPAAARVTARMAATRRDRITARLPMLRPPHPEGLLGAIRVELRGRRGTAKETVVLGAVDRPAVAAGTVAGLTAAWATTGRLARPGAAGLAELVAEPVPFLAELAHRGIRAAAFDPAGAGQDDLPLGAAPR